MHIEVNGTRLWFDVEGAALAPDGPRMRVRPTVLLLHGGPGSWDHSYLKPDFGRLADVAQVIWLDLRDHGRSAWTRDLASFSFEACADDVCAFCDALGIARPIVLGHSMGGGVAMLYGARHASHAGALLLVSTYARFDLPRMLADFRRLGGEEVARIVERTYGGERRSVTPDEWARVFRHFGPNVPTAEELARRRVNRTLNEWAMSAGVLNRFESLDQLPRITCPTLVCTGALDPVTPPAAAREIAVALPPQLARLEVIEGAGHFPWKDQPERFWSLLREFIGSLDLT